MEDNTNVVGSAAEATETKTEETVKTYTQEEVEALLQSEADRRVTAALKKAEMKNAAKIKEAEKLAQMNEQEKFEYQLQQREQAIAEKERELALMENKNEASKILAEKGISLSLVDFVVADDAETMKLNIDTLDKAFRASVKAEVEKRLASSAPKKNFVDSDTVTKESFNKLSVREQQELLRNNPELMTILLG